MPTYAGVVPGFRTSSAAVLVRVEDGEAEPYRVLAATGAASLSFAEQALAAAQLLEQEAPGVEVGVHLNLTGLGSPIADVFAAHLAGRLLSVRGVLLTDDEDCDLRARPAVVGRRYLWARLVTLIEAKALRLPPTDDGHRLYQAIDAMRPDTLFPEGEQGTLLLALGLAVCAPQQSGAGILSLGFDPIFDQTPDEPAPDPDDPYSVFWRVPSEVRLLKRRRFS